MTWYFYGDLRTGVISGDLDVLSGPWDDRLNTSESISVSVDLRNRDIQSLNLHDTAKSCKTFLGVAEGSTIMAAGPVWSRSYSRGAATLSFSAKGMHSYFDHRHILPIAALTAATTSFAITDPFDPKKTIPNPALATILSSLSLGTIAKRLVQQARLWTGGNLPIVFQADEAGINQRRYDGLEFKSIGEALNQLSEVENGPDINFQPRFTSGGLGVEWLFQTGTTAQPFISSSSTHIWDVTAAESSIAELTIDEDGSKIGSLAWATGGRVSDEVLIARAYASLLVDSGYPLYEILDTSHSTVNLQNTLNGYAVEASTIGKRPIETWGFKVEARPKDIYGNAAGPQVGQFSVGDFADLIVSKFDPVLQKGDPFIPEGKYRHRIVGLSGDEQGTRIGVQCAPDQVG